MPLATLIPLSHNVLLLFSDNGFGFYEQLGGVLAARWLKVLSPITIHALLDQRDAVTHLPL